MRSAAVRAREGGAWLRAMSVVAASAVALLALTPSRGTAQVPPLPVPTLAPSPTPTPTPGGGKSTKPAPRRKAPAERRRPADRVRATTPPAPPPTTAGGPEPFPGAVSDAVDRWLNRNRSPARSTARLLDLLAGLAPSGRPTQAEIIKGFGRFPVAGYVWYQDDWAAPRYTPYFHLHEGTDLFAAQGTPAIAAGNGRIAKLADGSIGGISIWLAADDGNTYYYGHLMAYARGIRAGMRVRTGDVLGYVGDTGVAKGTSPHVHFEVHPFGGPAVNPKPLIDRWLARAEQRALLASGLPAGSPVSRTGPNRWLVLDEVMRLRVSTPALLWTSLLDPGGSSSGVADLALDALMASVDWGRPMLSTPRAPSRRGWDGGDSAPAVSLFTVPGDH